MNINELDKETAAKLGLALEHKKATRPPRKSKMRKDSARSHAIKVLNTVANLTQAERKQVLALAQRLNEV
tara:strand:+ start:2408 stop:2617 length:210 start_codon:yes stop_codon:yes gene_type:complete